MCNFFSVVSDGAGNILYFNAEQRKQILSRQLRDSNGNIISETDSHTSIMATNGIYGTDEDMYNKYEYNPLTKEFTIDAMNNKDDRIAVKEKVMNLDYKTIVPELQIKEIVNPLNIVRGNEVTESEIALLKTWDSVLVSVGASVRDSVWASVGDSVWASVWVSVWDSVRDSVRDSVGGYISSFFTIENWKYIDHGKNMNPFQSCIDLWSIGLIPSFNGKTWRLHAGKDAKIVFQISKDELSEYGT